MIKNKIINYTIFAFSFFVWSNLHILHQPDSGQNCIFRGTKSSKVEKKRIFAYICIQKSPELKFIADNSIEHSAKINKLLKEVLPEEEKEEKDGEE